MKPGTVMTYDREKHQIFIQLVGDEYSHEENEAMTRKFDDIYFELKKSLESRFSKAFDTIRSSDGGDE